MWDLPRSGLEPVSPELADGFLTTAPPGKPLKRVFGYNPPTVHSGKHCKFIFKCHHREEMVKKKPDVIAISIENTFPSKQTNKKRHHHCYQRKAKEKCEKQHSKSTDKSAEVGKKLDRQQLIRIP